MEGRRSKNITLEFSPTYSETRFQTNGVTQRTKDTKGCGGLETV
jgi:hypothetical protein